VRPPLSGLPTKSKFRGNSGGNTVRELASWAAIGFAGISAVLGMYAAFFIPVRDNMDAFIGDLQKQARWTALAATAAGLSVLAQALDKWLG
jgi:hypothetical protein